jgi:hypothetical protein
MTESNWPWDIGYKAGRTGMQPGQAVIPLMWATYQRLDFWAGFREGMKDYKDEQKELSHGL